MQILFLMLRDLDETQTMSTFIYFNNFDNDMNLTESNIKSECRIQNINDMSKTTNFQILSPVSSTSNLNFSPVKNSSHLKSLPMPLQHYMYEDLSSSNKFLEKVSINNLINYSKNIL
jgi:hypothetical protein